MEQRKCNKFQICKGQLLPFNGVTNKDPLVDIDIGVHREEFPTNGCPVGVAAPNTPQGVVNEPIVENNGHQFKDNRIWKTNTK